MVLHREALELRPQAHPDRSSSLNSRLASCLWTRYQQLGAVADLEEAIVLAREAVDLTPRGHLQKPRYLTHLGNCLFTRFACLGEPSGLEDAISSHKYALDFPMIASTGPPISIALVPPSELSSRSSAR